MSSTLTDRVLRTDSIALREVSVEIIDARQQPWKTKLALRPLTVGTDSTNDIIVMDPRVSRRHCELSLGEDSVVVKDLLSKNGTWVEGVRVTQATALPGQTLVLGGTRIRFQLLNPQRVSLASAPRFGGAVGATVAMRALFAQLLRVAQTDSSVLLVGESGTGKELLAEGIHEASPRRGQPFVVLDCSAMSASLIDAELFGHVKGAFTGADNDRAGLFKTAQGGTLFIDEIGELPIALQPKLLRALETKQVHTVGSQQLQAVDLRIIAATSRDLNQLVAAQKFREDLYYRLAVFEARIPPLRERASDIPLLVENLLEKLSPPRSLASLPPHSIAMLQTHSWPGNVRELRNVISRLVLFPHATISLPSTFVNNPRQSLKDAREAMVEQFEKVFIEERLAEAGANVSKAARSMGISRQFLHRLMVKYGHRGT